MGNDKRGAPFHQIIHSHLDSLFGARIHRAGCLVQNQHAPVSQNSTGNGQKLTLPLTDIARIFINLHIVATWQGTDEMISECRFGCRFNLFIGRIKATIAYVFPDRPLEQPSILQNHTE